MADFGTHSAAAEGWVYVVVAGDVAVAASVPVTDFAASALVEVVLVVEKLAALIVSSDPAYMPAVAEDVAAAAADTAADMLLDAGVLAAVVAEVVVAASELRLAGCRTVGLECMHSLAAAAVLENVDGGQAAPNLSWFASDVLLLTAVVKDSQVAVASGCGHAGTAE